MQFAGSVLTEWRFATDEDCSALVIPDGCVDLIVKRAEDRATWFLSDLSECSYSVEFAGGDNMAGLRLKPGAIVNEHALGSWLQCNDPADLFESDQLDEFCHIPASLVEALDCLAIAEVSVNGVAKKLGVSTRTLQRVIGKHTGRSPYFWLALARIRRTCRSLHQFDRLTDAAAEFGFSDQAHMTREVARWFGVTPGSITKESDIFEQLQQTGYG